MKTRLQPGIQSVVVYIGLVLIVLVALSIYLQLEIPEPDGPHRVGRTIYRWVDTARAEILTADPTDHREVIVMIWHPAVSDTGTETEYFPGLAVVADELVKSGEVMWWQALGLRWVRTGAPLNAEPLKEQAPFPVVLLAPGNGTNIEFYSSLAGALASHGYIVVGINHPYDVAAVELSDGKIAPYDKEQWTRNVAAHQNYIAERHVVKVDDVLFVLDQLEILNADTSSPFAGMFDLESMAAAGHSLGGVVASDACKQDSRFKACINFDGIQKGGPFSMDESAIPPAQPFLFLTKEAQLHPQLIQGFEATSASYWITVHGALYTSFTDTLLLQPSLLPGQNRADEHMQLIQDYTLAFLDQFLKGPLDIPLLEPVESREISVKVFPSR